MSLVGSESRALFFVFYGGENVKKRLAIALVLLAVLIPVAVGATVMISNVLRGNFRVVDEIKIYWVKEPTSDIRLQSGCQVTVNVTNPSPMEYGNLTLQLMVQNTNGNTFICSPMMEEGFCVTYYDPTTTPLRYVIVKPDIQTPSITKYYSMNIPNMTANSYFLANFSMCAWNDVAPDQPPLVPPGSYRYELVVMQAVA